MSEIRVDNITDEAGTGRPDFTNGIKTSNINGGPIGRRNAIINGNFGVNQRGVSGTVNLSAGEYGHDRWKAGSSGATYTFSTSGGVTTIDISAGSLIQVVEDVNLVTDTYVLSFEGTAQGKIGSGSFGDSGVVESVTGGSNLNIEFSTGTVSKVQLEVGDTATEFEHRSIGEELALCQRYYEIVKIRTGSQLGSGSIGIAQNFAVEKRASPSITYGDTFSADNSVFLHRNSGGGNGGTVTMTGVEASSRQFAGFRNSSNLWELIGFVRADAEL